MKKKRSDGRIPRLYSSQKNSEDFADLFSAVKLLGMDARTFIRIMDKIEGLPVHLWIHDKNYVIVYGNSYFLEDVGDCVQQPCYRYLMGGKQVCTCCPSNKCSAGNCTGKCILCRRNDFGYDINIFHTPITNMAGDKFIIKSSYYLEEADDSVHRLAATGNAREDGPSSPVRCSVCNRIKDNNKWVSIDSLPVEHSQAGTSPAICPECIRLLYPGPGRKLGNINRA